MSDKKIKSCESDLVCKSTASLQEEIKEDLLKADGSLEELLQDDTEQTETILRILAYAGIVLNNPQIVQAASAAVQNQNINEKR